MVDTCDCTVYTLCHRYWELRGFEGECMVPEEEDFILAQEVVLSVGSQKEPSE